MSGIVGQKVKLAQANGSDVELVVTGTDALRDLRNA